MPDILVVQNARLEGPGGLGKMLQSDGFGLDVVFAKKEKIPPLDHMMVMVLGAPESANDDLGYLKNEMSLIREASERNIPVLGVCLGSQLIAKAFGANVFPGPLKEIGFYDDIMVDSESGLFSGISSPFTVFHWHGDTFDIPKGATRLAYSGLYNQAFQVGSAVGVQFHLEVDRETILSWLENASEDLSKIPYIDPNVIQNQMEQSLPSVQRNMKIFYRNFKSAFNLTKV
jgi:GMP synthase-like glutamine amidotransferase